MNGWLYVLTNPAMPGLCKVGMTTRTPEQRAAELHDTGSAVPYDVAAAWPVDDVQVAERDAHMSLAPYRISREREWFRVPASKAIEILAPPEVPPNSRRGVRAIRIVRGIVEGFGWLVLVLMLLGY